MDTPFPLEPTAAAAQDAIAEEFAYFGDWSERYQYLIDLGKKLPPLDATDKVEANRIKGCQSLVWIVAEGDRGRLDFRATSDSTIVSGLIYLALRVYAGRPAEEIAATAPDYIGRIGLAKHLSPTRSNGLAAVLQFIQDTARDALATAGAR
jgi:cysteine desulfuration protein SufE